MPNSVKLLYIIIANAIVYIEQHNGNKYLTLVDTDESKGTLKMYGEMLTRINDLIRLDLIRLTSNNADDYDEKYMKIKLR